MNKIYIVSSWNKQDITKSWSGTSYQIYNQFKNLRDVCLVNSPTDLLFRGMGKINKFMNIWEIRELQYYYSNYFVKKQIVDKNVPVLSIGSIRNMNNPTYIYVDNLYCTSILLYKNIAEGWGYNPWNWMNKSNISSAIEFEHNIIRKAKVVFCMGKWLTDFAKDYYKDCEHKFYTAYGGMNIQHMSDTSVKRRKNTVLFVGRDFYRKAGDIVFEAVNIVRQMYNKDIKLLIAGPNENPIKGNYEWVEFFGDIPYSKVSELMKEASLFCMPSRFEAYGIVFPEALCSGIPCIGRKSFEMPNFIDEGITGELLESNDPNELANKICKILKNPIYLTNVEMFKNEYTEKYNWENTVSLMNELIE